VGTTDSDRELLVHLNLARRMQLNGINQLWVADIAFVGLQQEFVFFGSDSGRLFAQGLAGHSIVRLAAQLAVRALQNAISSCASAPGLVHHSDRGIQYASAEYGALLDKQQITASMSRLGNPWDNAKCESFMKTLECEEIRANEYRGMEDLGNNVACFVDVYYNSQRLHSALGYNTPKQFEATICPAAPAGNGQLSFPGIGRSFNPTCQTKRSRPRTVSRIIALMSLRLAIPCRVGLHQSPAPLHQPRSS